ncbi:MAG: hypothetical protein LBQ57_10420 [Spirochaetales bacterium]|jgi:hypothetical protein|nr:hypothetical protein [Spirochaetales bacterium]
MTLLKIKAFFGVALSLAIFAACSGNPPVITEVRYRLTSYQDRETNKTGEYLSLAILAGDDDGKDDLESVSLINDAAQLYWQAVQDEWVVRPARQQSWIVLEKILLPDALVPLGRYRVIVRDYAGSQAERAFAVTADKNAGLTFPSLEAGENGALVVATSRNESVLMVQSGAGVLLGSFILRRGSNPRDLILSNEQIRAQAKNLYLWEQDPSGRSLLAGPWAAEDFLFSVNTGAVNPQAE